MAVFSFKNKTYSRSMLNGNEAYDPGAMVAIASVTLSSNAESVSFTSIPQTYSALQIYVTTRLSLNYLTPNFYFNNSTSSVYAQHGLSGDGSAASADASASRSNIQFVSSGSSQTANVFGVALIDIHDYASTTKYKTVRVSTGYDNNGSGQMTLRSGLWQSTDGINRIDFTTGFGAGYYLVTGTRIDLFGIKG